MGLYEKILAERAEEEQRSGRPLGQFRGVVSTVLDWKLNNAPVDRSHQYVANLGMLHRYVRRGPMNAGTGMRYASLKRSIPRRTTSLRPSNGGRESFCRRGASLH